MDDPFRAGVSSRDLRSPSLDSVRILELSLRRYITSKWSSVCSNVSIHDEVGQRATGD